VSSATGLATHPAFFTGGHMSQHGTIQRLADLTDAELAKYPFEAGRRAFWTLPWNEPAEPKGHRFTAEDVEILRESDATGEPPDLRRLEAFLAERCNFVRGPVLHWLDWETILAALAMCIEGDSREGASEDT